MSCNCNGCGQPERLCRCPKGKGEAPKRAYIAECTDCDPCRPCESMVKICSFVTPTLTEGQKFRNSFVYNQEDDSVYYISDDGTPTRFGSSPMFINAFNPDDRKIPRQVVFDFMNNKTYVYDPEGNYITIDLASDDVYHIYVPELGNVENAQSPFLIGFRMGPHIENPEVVVKDANGNDILPEDFANVVEKMSKARLVIHVPRMEHVSRNSAGDYTVEAGTFYVNPGMGCVTAAEVGNYWVTGGGLLTSSSVLSSVVISAGLVEGEAYYDAEIALPVKLINNDSQAA